LHCGLSFIIFFPGKEDNDMPEWSSKDERKYEKIKESSKQRGVREARAKEIAARTVNKQRREEGRTPQKSTQGTGNPNRRLEERSREELYNQAKKRNVSGRSKMSKGELVDALRSR
jgi:plasmid stabilization system protein ParE